jgi:RND superfamily putative drug exporter
MRFIRIGEQLVRGRRAVAVVAAVLVVVAGAFGADAASRLSSGGFEDPGSDSARARALVTDAFGSGDPDVVLLVEAPPGATVDDGSVVAVGQRVTTELAELRGVVDVTSYWALGSPPPLRADDAGSALVLGRLTGGADQRRATVAVISESFTRERVAAGARPRARSVGGLEEVYREMSETVEQDLAVAEAVALPVTLLLLLLVFRSLVAAVLPLMVGVVAVTGTLFVLDVVAGMTTVSIFALNLTTALGLGLAIDYSLLVVTRYREERSAGHDTASAVVRTVATAGRSVVFSGLTVAVSLGALLVFPLPFLRSFAYAGIPVVLLAVLGSVVVLPAVLALLGDRIDRGALPGRLGRHDPTREGRFWRRVAQGSMRHPVPVVAATLVLLGVLGAPFTHLRLGQSDDRVLPADATSRQVSEHLREHYGSNESGVVTVASAHVGPDAAADTDRYAAALSTLDGVARVDAPTGVYAAGARLADEPPLAGRFAGVGDGAWFAVVPAVEPLSADGERLVAAVRAAPAPFEVVVGGPTAELVDARASLYDRLPWALGIIATATFVLLFLSFGSVVVPAKALVLNTLSLSATFGLMVWIFQDGNLADTLGVTTTGALDVGIPVLMFCIAFGLSMDYEVFLLSRIVEERHRTGDDVAAVAEGLARTGRIITAAALLISVVFLAFATSGVSVIKLFGFGLTVAVLMDATVVRALLVPAFLRLAGSANWWAPAPLRRLYERAGMSEQAAAAALDLRDTLGTVPDEAPTPVGV